MLPAAGRPRAERGTAVSADLGALRGRPRRRRTPGRPAAHGHGGPGGHGGRDRRGCRRWTARPSPPSPSTATPGWATTPRRPGHSRPARPLNGFPIVSHGPDRHRAGRRRGRGRTSRSRSGTDRPARARSSPRRPRRAWAPARAARCRTACPTVGRRWSRRSAAGRTPPTMFGELVADRGGAGAPGDVRRVPARPAVPAVACWSPPACWRRCSSCSTACAASR